MDQDFVIRQGFPALRLPDGRPWLQGDEPLPAAPVLVYADALTTRTTTTTTTKTTSNTRDSLSNSSSLVSESPPPATLTTATTSNPPLTDHPASRPQETSPWQALYEDCRTVFTARTRDADAAYSAGRTYFWPAVQPRPRCALEQIVQAIFQAHTAHLPPSSIRPEQSGAEWWTLVLDPDEESKPDQPKDGSKRYGGQDGGKGDDNEEEEEESDEVGLHFDADYGLEDQVTNLFLHPRVGTVTYLTNSGAPTVVLDRPSPQPHSANNMESLNGDIRRGWLCHPTRGNHLAFDGRLLHGAPATFFPAHRHKDDHDPLPPPLKKAKTDASTAAVGTNHTGTNTGDSHQQVAKVSADPSHQSNAPITHQRITLLVNVWVNHCPLDAEPLEDEICAQLTCPLDVLQFATQLSPDSAVMPDKTITLRPSTDNPAGEEEVVIGNRIVTAHYGSTMEDLHAAASAATLVALEWEPRALQLVVGDVAPVHDQEEDEDDNDSGNEER